MDRLSGWNAAVVIGTDEEMSPPETWSGRSDVETSIQGSPEELRGRGSLSCVQWEFGIVIADCRTVEIRTCAEIRQNLNAIPADGQSTNWPFKLLRTGWSREAIFFRNDLRVATATKLQRLSALIFPARDHDISW